MTKLFSMKTLAFAGAAAFALTLAAAPKADAADAKITDIDNCDNNIYVITDGDLTSTKDGEVIYYQVAKDENKLKKGKYSSIADEDLGYFNISKFLGKEQVLSISTNGDIDNKETTKNIKITAAPKVKIKCAGTKIELKIDNSDATLTTEGAINTEYVAKVGDKKYDVYGLYQNTVKENLALGGTVEITVQEVLADTVKDTITSPSKPAKMKISAKAKAPKVSLKLDATKAFEWKLSDKQEYIINCESKEIATDWKPGIKGNWESIFKGAGITEAKVKEVVSGDAITADVDISVRTKATEKKAASAINLVKLKKSAASPTTQASIETTKASNWNERQKKYKTVTGASIKADVDIQYSVDNGEKWKVVKAGKTQKLKVDQKDVLVRIVTPARNGVVLPSLNTKMTWDPETGKATTVSFDYDEKGAVKVLPAKNIEAK